LLVAEIHGKDLSFACNIILKWFKIAKEKSSHE
jgi:hypothetical protein